MVLFLAPSCCLYLLLSPSRRPSPLGRSSSSPSLPLHSSSHRLSTSPNPRLQVLASFTMAEEANPRTLFHLVPMNDAARVASKVEPIAPEPAVPNPTPAPRAPAMAHMRRPGALPLVKYPRPARQPLQLDVRKAPAMRPIGGGGITKPRAHKPSVQVAQVERALFADGGFTRPRLPGPPGWPATPQRTPFGGGGIKTPAAPAPPPSTPPVEQPLPEQVVSSKEMSEGQSQLNQSCSGYRRMPGCFPS